MRTYYNIFRQQELAKSLEEQLNLFRSITTKFEAKMAEIDLLRLSGSLIR